MPALTMLTAPTATAAGLYAPSAGALAVRLPEPKEKMMNDKRLREIDEKLTTLDATLEVWGEKPLPHELKQLYEQDYPEVLQIGIELAAELTQLRADLAAKDKEIARLRGAGRRAYELLERHFGGDADASVMPPEARAALVGEGE